MPDNLVDQLEENGLNLAMVEDGLAETIANTVSEILPEDTEINDCYPTGWDV